jgi:hypothetical protein
MTIVELAPRLVLRYKPGQYTFRNFIATATNTQLHNLAVNLNAFQNETAKEILKVRTFEFS